MLGLKLNHGSKRGPRCLVDCSAVLVLIIPMIVISLQLLLGEGDAPPAKKPTKPSPYFVPDLCHILALCEDRIPFLLLGQEVGHTGA